MKIYALADMHGKLPSVPECDICIIAGDICPIENHNVFFQNSWLDTTFRKWLNEIPAKHIIGIAGNHDIVFEKLPEIIPKNLPWTYLLDQMIEIEGIKIFGTPYQKYFGGWPFMKHEDELEVAWRAMPYCDILVCHGPPFGAGDYVLGTGPQGSKTLTRKLMELQIPWCISGHIHDNYGKIGRAHV